MLGSHLVADFTSELTVGEFVTNVFIDSIKSWLVGVREVFTKEMTSTESWIVVHLHERIEIINGHTLVEISGVTIFRVEPFVLFVIQIALVLPPLR